MFIFPKEFAGNKDLMALYCTFSIIAALLIFSVYNVLGLIHNKGIPKHLSESYYLFSSIQLGWIFPCLMFVMIALIVPVWIIINSQLQLSHLTYLIGMIATMIFGIMLLCDYHDRKIRKKLHYFMAYTAGISSVVWILIACPIYWYIPFLLLILFAIIGICTKSAVRSFRYWIELVAFYSIMIVLLLLSLSNL